MFLTRSEDKCATPANTTLHCYEQQLSRNLMKRSKCWPVNLIVEQTCYWQHCDWLMQLRTDQATCVRVHSGAAPLTWQLFYLNEIKASYFKLRNGPQIWHLTDFLPGLGANGTGLQCVCHSLLFTLPTFCHIAWEKSSFCLHECRRDGTRGIRTKRWLIVRGAGFPIRSTWRLEQFAVCAAEIASRKRRPFGRRAETMSSLSRHVRLFCREFKGCGWNNWKWVSEKVKKKKTSPSYMTYIKYIT